MWVETEAEVAVFDARLAIFLDWSQKQILLI